MTVIRNCEQGLSISAQLWNYVFPIPVDNLSTVYTPSRRYYYSSYICRVTPLIVVSSQVFPDEQSWRHR